MAKDAKAAKSERLAEALRANLRRRKAAAKDRQAGRDGAQLVDPPERTADEDKSRG